MEPFANIVEWFDLLENIEGDLFFFRSCDSNLPQIVPPFVIPAKVGNDKRESVFWLQCAKRIKSHPQMLSKNRFLYSFGDFGYPRNRA
jgi:hypothetical protein